ncbi:hypothetical protein ACQ4PT_063336 [Festuca glaucescens]
MASPSSSFLPPPPPVPAGFSPASLPGFCPSSQDGASASYRDALLSPAAPRPRLQSMIVAPSATGSSRNDVPPNGSFINGGGWETVGSRRRPSSMRASQLPPSQLKLLLLKKARGKCFRCLSKDHRTASCRNFVVCLLCGEIGHRARWYKKPLVSPPPSSTSPAPWAPPARLAAAAPVPPAAAQSAPAPPPAAAQSAPATRLSTAFSCSHQVPMEAPGGNRREAVVAMAPRSMAQADAEQLLGRHAVVTTVVGFRPSLELFEITRGMALHFRIAEADVKVTVHAPGEFLLRSRDPAVKREALQHYGPLVLRSVSFLLSPWTRLRRATASNLLYQVRVCLEGVPDHAWDVVSVAPLFTGEAIIDHIDDSVNSEQETACLRLWVWMSNVDMLAMCGVLKLEEPTEVPLLHFPELGILQDVPSRSAPLKMIDHPILIHWTKSSITPAALLGARSVLRASAATLAGPPPTRRR